MNTATAAIKEPKRDSKGRALACIHCGKAIEPADGWEVCSEACAEAVEQTEADE